MLKLFHQTDIEFDSTSDGFEADALVVAVNGGALGARQVHGGEAVNTVGNNAPVAAVRALYGKLIEKSPCGQAEDTEKT